MYFCLCFALGEIFSRGGYSVHAQPEKVVAFAGGNAILPCSLKVPVNDQYPTVEWSKEGLESNVVFLYRDGYETFEMKNVNFEFRTSLFMREVKNGNVSLRMSNVKLSDAGTYQCLIIHRNKTKENKKIQLDVAAVSEPKLTVVFAQNDEMTVTCEASCWLPAAQIMILDDKGNDITKEVPKQEQDARGCYITRQTFSIQNSTRRVICRVNQPQADQNKTTEIILSVACEDSGFKIIWIIGLIFAALLLFGIFFYIRKNSCKNERKKRNRKSSESESITSSSEDSSFLICITEIEGNENIDNWKTKTIQQDEKTCKLEEKVQSVGAVHQHHKAATVQGVSESFQGFRGPLNKSSDLNSGSKKNPCGSNLKKKNSKQQSSKLSPTGISKRKLGQSSRSTEQTKLNSSGFAAGSDRKRDVHPFANINDCVDLNYSNNLTWPSAIYQSKNRYRPLADLQDPALS